MQLFVAKLIGLIALLFSSLLFGYLPTIIVKRVTTLLDESKRVFYERLMSLISCFGGGVFLATCLMDLFPEVESQLEQAFEKLRIKTNFPCPEFIVIIGFLIVLIIEQIVLAYKEEHPESHPLLGHSHSYSGQTSDASLNGISNHAHQDEETATSGSSSLRTTLLVLALSLHSIFEGLAVGLQPDINQIIQILVAVLIHKSIIAFTLGLNLVKSHQGIRFVIKCVLLFSAMSPFGLAIGMAVFNFDKGVEVFLVSGILQGIACGTFLYVTFFEVLPQELNNGSNRLLKLVSVILGFTVISLLILFLPS